MNLANLKFKHFIPIFGLLLCFGELQAQDIHASMFNRTPFNLNPGLVGVFGGDYRFIGNYRNQWNSVPVDYTTFTASVEGKFLKNFKRKSYFTGGLLFGYDNAGDLAVTQSEIGLSGSYVFPLSKAEVSKHYLSLGLQYGFNQRRFDDNKLQVDLQFDGKTFNPSLPTQEGQFQDKINYGNLSTGANYRYQNFDEDNEKRTRIDLGVAMYHLNTPNKDFGENQLNNEGPVDLEHRFTLYGLTSFQIRPKYDLGLLAMAQFQGPHSSKIFGINGRKYMNNNLALLLGLSYRSGDRDALIPNVNVDYKNLSFGASVDWNLSEFEVATNERGGFELSVIYTIAKPQPTVKPCLIF